MVIIFLFFTKIYRKEYDRRGKHVQLLKRYFNVELLCIPVWTWDLFLKVKVGFEVSLSALWMKDHHFWALGFESWKTSISQNLLFHLSHFSPLCILMILFSCPHFFFCILLSLFGSWLMKLVYFSTVILFLLWLQAITDTQTLFSGNFSILTNNSSSAACIRL